MTIDEARAQGWRIRVRHERPVVPGACSPSGWELGDDRLLTRAELNETGLGPSAWLPAGGRTAVRVETSDGCVAEGVAECSPRDNYCRRLGREIALGRALKELEHRRNDKRLAEASIARATGGWRSNVIKEAAAAALRRGE